MSQGHIQVPPDSTGKKVSTSVITRVLYNQRVGVLLPSSVITGGTSGATAIITSITPDPVDTSGEIYGNITSPGVSFINTESLSIGGVVVAHANLDSVELNTQQINISDPTNPDLQLRLSDSGSMLMKAENIALTHDLHGATMTTNKLVTGLYNNETFNKKMAFTTVGAGSIASVTTPDKAITLVTDVANGDISTLKSTLSHHFNMANGQEIVSYFTVVAGDQGKSGVVRELGLFSDTNGAFFRLNGQILELVARSNVTGSVVDTVLPATNWNGGKQFSNFLSTNGTITLDVSKINTYWVSIARSQIRFGIINEQSEVNTLHVESNTNKLPYPVVGSEDLRLTVQQYNNTVQVATSTIKLYEAIVFGKGTELEEEFLHLSNAQTAFTAASATETPILALRAATTYNAIPNARVILPEKICLYNADAPVIVRVYKNVTMTGGVWSLHGTNSSLESCTDFATFGVTLGQSEEHTFSCIAEVAKTTMWQDEPNTTGVMNNAIHVDHNGQYKNAFYVTVQVLAPATTSNVICTYNWDEVQ